LKTDKLVTSRQTLVDVLEKRASNEPERIAYRFLREGEVEHDSISFGDLRRRARRAAGRLIGLGAVPGESAAVLLYPQGIEFIVAFFACLYAGVVAVPASLSNRKRAADILSRMAADAGARWILSCGTQLQQMRRDIEDRDSLQGIACLDLEDGVEGSPLPRVRIESSAIAMLQYTSGSTGTPSGVVITHANLVDNQQQMQQSFEHDDTTVIVSWLPMFHDMGLGTVLMAVWTGRPCVFMAPSVFVQNPRRWLAAISHYRGTTSLAPDFAYDLCVRRVGPKEREGLDLSSWKVALNGSEPVRSSTIERFVEAFGPCGFRREAFLPAYGLAEATMFVTSDDAREPPLVRRFSIEKLEHGEAVPESDAARARALVSCGHPWYGSRLSIVDPETRVECPPERVGEVWLQGGAIGLGYWKKEVESKYTFQAMTADGRGPFLRTGDLGFVSEGRLFVAGRLKDLIIIRGRNHAPQDIEDSVSTCHAALVARACAAFSVDTDEGERLVVVQEVTRTSLKTLDAPSVIRAIRAVVSDNHALQTHAIVLLKPSSLPRTTSGKVRRKTCRQAFLDNSLPAVASWGAFAEAARDAGTLGLRAASQRADQVINWLRLHAVELSGASFAHEGHGLSSKLASVLASQGLLGLHVAFEHGGLGLGHFDSARVLEQLAAVDFSLALLIGANTYLGVQPIAKYANSHQRGELLSRLAQGRDFAGFAVDERDDGPLSSTDGHVQMTGEEPWQVFGTQHVRSSAATPSLIHAVAHHDEPPGSTAFMIARSAEGVNIVESGGAPGRLRTARTTVNFEGASVVRENLLGSFGSGNDVAREATLHMRLAVGAACIGAMKRCAQLASRESPYRKLRDKATPNPVILSRLSSAAARVTALEALVHTIARATDRGDFVPAEGFAACKLLGPEMLLRSIDDLMLIGVRVDKDESDQILGIYEEAGALRNFDGPPETLAEITGAAVMAEDTPLRLLIEETLGAPAVVSWVEPVIDAVRHRMKNLKGTLARRAERWGHTRTGELTTWLALLAAVEGCMRGKSDPELVHAHTWTLAQLEQAVTAVRLGTPSETATLDADDIAATFAAYARTIGNLTTRGAKGNGIEGAAPRERPSRDSGPVPERSTSTVDREAAKRELRVRIVVWLANRLRIPVSKIEAGRSFADHGLDSLSSVELAKDLSDMLGREIDATVVWNFATIDELAEHLATLELPSSRTPPIASNPTPRSSTSNVGLEAELAQLEQDLRSRS
jgi:acyl-CoA synthetase (AMP-forming)/AMP-acid ligase II/alkylation response protein AidB-like acyl-CoA dehydrogenase/acyl carrier protein